MSKLKLSHDGRVYTETWDITQTNYKGEPHLCIRLGQKAEHQIEFENDTEKQRFHKGVQFCRATLINGNVGATVYVGLFGSFKENKAEA